MYERINWNSPFFYVYLDKEFIRRANGIILNPGMPFLVVESYYELNYDNGLRWLPETATAYYKILYKEVTGYIWLRLEEPNKTETIFKEF